MIDPHYNNIEFYHGTPHGLAFKGIVPAGSASKNPSCQLFN
ncbi:MAG: hypothetical protein ABSA83_15990 [Verrucomicrobiota bacterium]|jgi:hypothetical protein